MKKNSITKKQIPLLIVLTIMYGALFYTLGITDAIQNFFTKSFQISATNEHMYHVTTFQEAEKSARNIAQEFDRGFSFAKDEIIERPYGWFFFGEEREFTDPSKPDFVATSYIFIPKFDESTYSYADTKDSIVAEFDERYLTDLSPGISPSNKSEAKDIAYKVALSVDSNAELEKVITRPYGWLFQYGPEQRIPRGDSGTSFSIEKILIFVGKDGRVDQRLASEIDNYVGQYDNDYIYKVLETPLPSPDEDLDIVPSIITDDGYGKARDIAREFVNQDQDFVDEHTMTLWDEKTIEKPYGWFFVFAPEKYIETLDIRYQVPGSPFIFVSKDGHMESIPSSVAPQNVFEEYDRMYKSGELDVYLNNL